MDNRLNDNDIIEAYVPFFYRSLRVDKFLEWQVDVDKYFNITGVPENMQFNIVVFRVKDITFRWWERIIFQRHGQDKGSIKIWQRMRCVMTDRFIPENYEYKMHIESKEKLNTIFHYEPNHIVNVFEECRNQNMTFCWT